MIGASTLLGAGANVGLVSVANGAPCVEGRAANLNAADRKGSGRIHQRELEGALAVLGRTLQPAVHFSIPAYRTIFHVETIARRLARIIRVHSFAHIVTHSYTASHPDHDATALSVHAACLLVELEDQAAPVVVEMLPPMSHEHRTDGYRSRSANPEVLDVRLGPAERELKYRLLSCYGSQRQILPMLQVSTEHFRPAPSYNFLAPPDLTQIARAGRAYDIEDVTWRRAAARSLYRLRLLEPVGGSGTEEH